MFDEFGGEYVGTKIQLGGYMTQNQSWQPYVTNSLVPQVPMKLRVTFDNVNPDAKTITLLRVAFEWVDSNDLNLSADFRDLPITK
jgi:hypothetical protein